MKLFTISALSVLFSLNVIAQSESQKPNYDTTKWDVRSADTIKIGNVLFIKLGKKGDSSDTRIAVEKPDTKKRVKTSWMAFDLGFANFMDKSNYGIANNYLVNKPGAAALGESDFTPAAGKSLNVNIWFVMQQIALIKKNVNLKYALGVELNNYRFKAPVSFKESGPIPYTNPAQSTASPFTYRDSVSFSKNKLALDYATIPVMLNFCDSKGKFSLSAGVSVGYLYSQRTKQKSGDRGKDFERGNLGFDKFKFSYVGEIGYGDVSLYGSYSPKSINTKGLDWKPFNLGLRFNFL